MVFIGSLGPIPSSTLFITAGLTTMRLAPVVVGFFVGRAINYTLSVAATSRAATSLESIFGSSLTNPRAIVLQLISIAAIVGFTRIPWTKVLHLSVPTDAKADTAEGAGKQIGTSPSWWSVTAGSWR